MIKILKKRILSNKGFSYVILSVLMIVILLMGVAIFEIIRINIQAAAVRDKFEDAIISMCVENYSEMYQPIRESHASSYAFNGTRWEERHKANEQYIRTYLNKAMSAGEIISRLRKNMRYPILPSRPHISPLKERDIFTFRQKAAL